MSTLVIAALILAAAIASVLVVIAAIYLGREQRTLTGGTRTESRRPRWFELVLAVVLVVALVVVGVLFAIEYGGDNATWRTSLRASVFLGVMLALGALGLMFLVVFLATRLMRPSEQHSTTSGPVAALPEAASNPMGTRLLGLALFAVGILLLGWVYLLPQTRAYLLLQVLYPAAIAVGIVLLFDKASRSWRSKPSTEEIREWLFCDLCVFALILGVVNLYQLQSRETYDGFFLDWLHVALFFLVFWLVDRTQFAGRFLVGLAYLGLLPVLLLLWRWVQDIAVPEDISWWSTIWPTVVLAAVFFVLEVISLVALRGVRGHSVTVIKDVAFVILYIIFLVIAVPSVE